MKCNDHLKMTVFLQYMALNVRGEWWIRKELEERYRGPVMALLAWKYWAPF
jgi:hypothetical protein